MEFPFQARPKIFLGGDDQIPEGNEGEFERDEEGIHHGQDNAIPKSSIEIPKDDKLPVAYATKGNDHTNNPDQKSSYFPQQYSGKYFLFFFALSLCLSQPFK